MTQTWTPISDQLPEEGITVDTKIHDEYGLRKEQELKRRGGLWFFPDMSMYVYYRPTHWKPAKMDALTEATRAALDRCGK